MAAGFIPARGDLVWLQFNPQAGHERAGGRPALVISPRSYNKKVGLALFCPITSQVKGYPFEVELPGGSKVGGVVLSDQIKSLDWRLRKAKRLGAVSESILEEVTAKVLTLIESPRF